MSWTRHHPPSRGGAELRLSSSSRSIDKARTPGALKLSRVKGSSARRERDRGGARRRLEPPLSLLASVFSLGAFVLVAAACGAETVPPERSSEDGGSAGTARVEQVIRDSGAGGEGEFRTSSVVDFDHNRSSWVDSTTGCSTIAIGEVSYTEVPRAAGMPDGKRWVKYTQGQDGNSADLEAEFEKTQEPQSDGSTTSLMFAFPDPPPAEYLPYLRRQGELKRIGEEDVRGVATTRYRTKVDRKRLIREQLEQMGWKDTNIEAYLEQTPETEEIIDVWVDAADRPRRVLTTSSTDLGEPFGTDRSVSTAEYFDFGAQVEILAPPPVEVLDAAEWERINEERMHGVPAVEEPPFESLSNGFEANVQPTCEG